MATPPLPFGYSLRSPSPLFVPHSIPSSPVASPSPPHKNFIKVEDYISNSTPCRAFLSISSSSSSSSSSTPNSSCNMPPTTRAQASGARSGRRPPPSYEHQDDDGAAGDGRRKRRRIQDDFDLDSFIDPLDPLGLHEYHTTGEDDFPSDAQHDIIDLTDDPSPLATHTEREVQAARTLESLKRKGRAQRDGLGFGAESSSNLGSRDRPILLDDAEEISDDLSRKASVHQELVRQQELAALEASKREGDKRITFNTMNCVICMDVPTDLTMAACGHVFCYICIQEALKHSENQQRDHPSVRKAKCPVCRKTMKRTNAHTLIPLLIMKGKRKDKSRALSFALE